MLRRTTSRSAPWHIVRSDNKHLARLEAMKIILNSVDYDGRNYSLDFDENEKDKYFCSKRTLQMRKKRLLIFYFTKDLLWNLHLKIPFFSKEFVF